MATTPGVILPSSYPSNKELLADLKRRDVMSGFTSFNEIVLEHSDDEILDFLEHFGVKGMKWGVRKSLSSVADGARIAKHILKRVGSTNLSDIPSMRYSHGYQITNMVQNILDLTS